MEVNEMAEIEFAAIELRAGTETSIRKFLDWVKRKDRAIIELLRRLTIASDAIDSALWQMDNGEQNYGVIHTILKDAKDQTEEKC